MWEFNFVLPNFKESLICIIVITFLINDQMIQQLYIDKAEVLKLTANVRRYVQWAQSRSGACFCTRGALHGYTVNSLFSRWQKPAALMTFAELL